MGMGAGRGAEVKGRGVMSNREHREEEAKQRKEERERT